MPESHVPLLLASDLRDWRGCARRFWRRRQEGAIAAPAAAIDDGGVQDPAGERVLRASFPGASRIAAAFDAPRGMPADEDTWQAALRRTRDALGPWGTLAPGHVLLGACLQGDGVRVQIDVMQGMPGGLRLARVRYATLGDEADVDTVALWTHVSAHAGLRVAAAVLLLVDVDFIYPGHGLYAGLFREVDLGPQLGSREPAAWLAAVRACAAATAEPGAQTGAWCRQDGGCAFAGSCDAGPAPPSAGPARLELVGRELAATLAAQGHASLLDVPLSSLSDPRHRRALRAVRQNAPVIEPEVAAEMRALDRPRRLLRIDTLGFAVPIWPGTRPYQTLPYQWSCATETDAGWEHGHFIADHGGGDPRRAFATRLLQALGTAGAVLAYNAGFERNRLRDLAREFDDLAEALRAVESRIVDLYQIARARAYHPAMSGSWSFKSVARAFAPEAGAHRFDGPGESPQAAFACSLQPALTTTQRRRLREALRTQGRRELRVLARLVALFEAADPGQDQGHRDERTTAD